MNENKQMQQQLVGELEEIKDADLDTVVGGLLGLGVGVGVGTEVAVDLLGLVGLGLGLELEAEVAA